MACWVGPIEKVIVFYGQPGRPQGVKGLTLIRFYISFGGLK